MDDSLDFSELVNKLQELLEVGLYDEVLKLLDYYSIFYQDEWEIYFLYSRVYLEQNDPSTAITYLHKSLKIDKNNVDSLLGLFYAHAQMDHIKKGRKYLFRAEKYHPNCEPVLTALIWYYTEINDLESAIICFEKAQKIGTDNPETFRNAGIAYERRGNYDDAQQCFSTALRMNPHFDDVRDLLADHYLLVGQVEKSISLYREYLAVSPKNIRALSRLVFCLSQNNQAEEALALAQETIKLYPNSPVGYVDCSYVYLNISKFDEALSFAGKALDVSPIDAEAFRVRGIANSEKQLPEEAQRAFEAALGLDPKNPEIMRDYYHHLRNVGDFEKMEKLVNRVIRQEFPYCIEDYWFLADYHRDNGDNLKAFHFLHKAFTSMPGEKELIPPMVDILLDSGHVLYSVPFLMNYVERSGWNDTMNQFARHTRLKDKWSQEALRFLRFHGQNPSQYRNYIFLRYFEKFCAIAFGLFLPVLVIFFYFLIGLRGIAYVFAGTVVVFSMWLATKYIIAKKLHE
jgi:Tetratricopeptide repeat.